MHFPAEGELCKYYEIEKMEYDRCGSNNSICKYGMHDTLIYDARY